MTVFSSYCQDERCKTVCVKVELQAPASFTNASIPLSPGGGPLRLEELLGLSEQVETLSLPQTPSLSQPPTSLVQLCLHFGFPNNFGKKGVAQFEIHGTEGQQVKVMSSFTAGE